MHVEPACRRFAAKVAVRALVIPLAASAGVFGQESPAPLAPKAYTAVEPANRDLDASLYMQTAAEYRASCYQAYNLAIFRLTELLKQKPNNPGVVMDLDETVFDNGGFQAMLLRSGLAWDSRLWEAWEREDADKIALIPGAKEFILEAKRLGVAVIFVSNRDEEFKEQTKSTFKRLEIPVERDDLLKLKKKGEDDNKSSRFQEAANQYTVLLHVGDNLRDFDDNLRCAKLANDAPGAELDRAIKERKDAVDKIRANWGEGWIILPNPAYGEWTKPLGRGVADFDRLVRPISDVSSPLQPHSACTTEAMMTTLIVGCVVSALGGAFALWLVIKLIPVQRPSKDKPTC